MPQSYREILRRARYTTIQEAVKAVRYPPGTELDSIESWNSSIDAVNDMINSSWRQMMDYCIEKDIERGCVPDYDPRHALRTPASELDDYLKTLYAQGYKVSFSQANAFDDLLITMTTKDAELKASIWGELRYDPDAIHKRVETMKSTLELLDEEDEQ